MLNIIVISAALIVALCGSVFIDRQLPDHDRFKPGDLIIAGMFPRSVQKPRKVCSDVKSRTSIKGAAAMVYGLEKITANASLLPNISLGYVLMDDCNNEAAALMKASQLIPVKKCVKRGCSSQNAHVLTCGTNPQYDVVGVVGPYGSTLQLRTSLLLSFYEIPHISWIATSDSLSDKRRYKYFSRVVPPDRFQARALVDIVNHYNWSYVSVLHSEGSYGSSGIRYVRQALKEYNICTAYSKELRDDFGNKDYDRVVYQLKKNSEAKVVVMFVESRHGKGVMLALERNNATHYFVLLSTEGLSLASVGAVTLGKRNWITLVITAGNSPGFKDYYKKQSPFGASDKIWSGEYTDKHLECSWDVSVNDSQSCHRFKSYYDVPNHYMTNWPTRILDAVETFGLALHSLVADRCPEASRNKNDLRKCIDGPLLLKYIHKTKFQGMSTNIEYDEAGDLVGGGYQMLSVTWDGEMKYTVIGHWDTKTRKVVIDEDKVVWWKETYDGIITITSDIPESVCAKPCKVGEFYLMGELSCCWECHKCRNNELLRPDMKGCDVCPLKTWPDQVNFTTCEPILPSFIHWLDPIALCLSALAGGMLLIMTIITAIFIKHKEKKVIKGSNRELMTPIIFGLFLAFSIVYLFIMKAENWICYVNYFGFNLSCTLIFGPLFLKTLRMYRIFAAAEKYQVRIKGVDSGTQITAMVFILIIEVAILVVTAYYQPPIAEETMPVPTIKHVELSCQLPQMNLLFPLCYNILLLILCSAFGFLTRRLPDNFNESWFIFISVTTTLFVWTAFLPTYFMAFYAHHKSTLFGLALILNGGVTVLCLFAPKIYALYFVNEKGIKVTNFDFPEVSTKTLEKQTW